LATFRGTWGLVYWLYDGTEHPVSEPRYTLSFAGQHFAIRRGGTVSEEGALEDLDPGQTPKAFTYAPTTLEGAPVHLR
jgi:hypothetical protein